MRAHIGHIVDKLLKLIGQNVEKPLIKESSRYTPKKPKHVIPFNDCVNDI